MAQCLLDSAAVLDKDDPDRRARFLQTVSRCKDFVVCDYYVCATSNPGGSP